MQWLQEKFIYSQTKTKLKVVRFLAQITLFLRKILGLKKTNLPVRRKKINYQVDLNEAIDFCLYLTGEYEPELIQAYLPLIQDKKLNIIDIGANIGAHTLQFAYHTDKEATIYAIEPTSFAFNKLKTNINLNPKLKDKIHINNVLLTNPEGQWSHEKISASWNIAKKINGQQRNQFDGGFPCSTQSATKMTLDHFIQQNNIQQIDLIKLDVDGNEIDVLKGAKETFQRFRPILLVELSPIHFDNPDQPYNFQDQLDLLNSLNYDFQDIFGNPIELDQNKILQKMPSSSLMNIIGFAKNGGA